MNEMEPFRKYINQFSSTAERDLKMLKWTNLKRDFISNLISFKNKTVLDVGCSVGYICTWASKVAKHVTGFDIREDILKVAKHVKKDLGEERCGLEFSIQDWEKFQPPIEYNEKFDIVICTALLHYFHREEYGEALAKLAYVCKNELIIEMKVLKDIDDKPRIYEAEATKTGSTIPTFKWLKRALLRCGFKLLHRISGDDWPEGGLGRELWVLKRLPEVPYQASWPAGIKAGTTVAIPMNHLVLDYYYNTVNRGTADWWIWVGHAARNFKPWLFLPLVYQPARSGLADGGHRLMVAKRLGHKTIKVRMM